ncbi:uncharacterized protein MYCFIDRAFT_179000 [Pseudocercospora fijiensis CIRAD86]|uniref:Uncharacterized protein n=1 Tax=Pseudocercospora fijiensis (strain CIRAD86) TaxID=383855 RepID=M3AN76_PSEFD|nr:uncharacterized protein MYCFIDRAFT_179000 [Pseudocercospora fijiensis CIRAD86]EME78917.1 hypothetical protein MYCFIDRAFT_179000 [Pseudocercospora fijiensis CIRAD86]
MQTARSRSNILDERVTYLLLAKDDVSGDDRSWIDLLMMKLELREVDVVKELVAQLYQYTTVPTLNSILIMSYEAGQWCIVGPIGVEDDDAEIETMNVSYLKDKDDVVTCELTPKIDGGSLYQDDLIVELDAVDPLPIVLVVLIELVRGVGKKLVVEKLPWLKLCVDEEIKAVLLLLDPIKEVDVMGRLHDAALLLLDSTWLEVDKELNAALSLLDASVKEMDASDEPLLLTNVIEELDVLGVAVEEPLDMEMLLLVWLDEALFDVGENALDDVKRNVLVGVEDVELIDVVMNLNILAYFTYLASMVEEVETAGRDTSELVALVEDTGELKADDNGNAVAENVGGHDQSRIETRCNMTLKEQPMDTRLEDIKAQARWKWMPEYSPEVEVRFLVMLEDPWLVVGRINCQVGGSQRRRCNLHWKLNLAPLLYLSYLPLADRECLLGVTFGREDALAVQREHTSVSNHKIHLRWNNKCGRPTK